MYIVKLLRFLRGYVRFFARGGSIERFINLCAHHGIPTWGCRKTEEHFTGYTSANGYRRMHRLSRKAGVRLRAGERHGLPFLTFRYRRRIGITAGAVLFALAMLLSQQFIWVVQVEGNESVDTQLLQNALSEAGVRRGVLKHNVDTGFVGREMMLRVDDLSFAAVYLHGTTATLVVRERAKPPRKIDTGVPANVVASQDGQIKRMEVIDGVAVCKAGDAVRAGDLIVSGVYEDRWGLTHFMRANAKVIAHVPQSLEVQVPLLQEQVRQTGKVTRRRYLEVMGLRVPLFLYHGLEGDYKLEQTCLHPTVFGMELPFEISRETYIFYERDEQEISPELALRMAERELLKKEQAAWGDAILMRQAAASTENGILTLRGEYVVEVDIAEQVEIPVHDRKNLEDPKPIREGGY